MLLKRKTCSNLRGVFGFAERNDGCGCGLSGSPPAAFHFADAGRAVGLFTVDVEHPVNVRAKVPPALPD